MTDYSLEHYAQLIERAPVYHVAEVTPYERAKGLSTRTGNNVFLKREDLQPVFSFKLRGAYNHIVHLSEAQRARGIIAASAGNHAQGVALAAQRLGLKALIVMPQTTPEIKVNSVRTLGARIVLFGSSYDEAYRHAQEQAAETGMCFVHPYDDPLVIAGQGTIAQELLEQATKIDAVFVPVGGGGLIAGIGAYLKVKRPSVRIIGVEPEDAACLHAAMQADERVVLPYVGLFSDGVAVRQIGKETFRLAKQVVDEVITVTTDEICAAIKDIFDDTRSITEPAGALGVAGIKKYVERNAAKDQHFTAIASGANMNFDRLRHVAERAEIGEHREALLAVTIPERPGSFRRFCETVGNRGITEFNYRMADPEQAHVFAGIQLQNGLAERDAIIAALSDADYPVLDMTDNEMAKMHIRYMVGGRGKGVAHERLFRFIFPERPGALLHFLNGMGQHWNISLFHYRNHGSAYGRVLVGMQVPPEDEAALRQFLADVGYPWWEESDNPAYTLFLS